MALKYHKYENNDNLAKEYAEKALDVDPGYQKAQYIYGTIADLIKERFRKGEKVYTVVSDGERFYTKEAESFEEWEENYKAMMWALLICGCLFIPAGFVNIEDDTYKGTVLFVGGGLCLLGFYHMKKQLKIKKRRRLSLNAGLSQRDLRLSLNLNF